VSLERERLSRRQLVRLAAALPLPVLLGRLGAARAALRPLWGLRPTPACHDGDTTPPDALGPFFKPRSPRRRSLLRPGLHGTRLVVTGSVLSRGCDPVAGALLDFWQADAAGHYDNRGFRLRGHQFSDRRGRYRLETVVPGLYPGRTRHIHVRVQAPGSPVLTTQLFFPGEARNRTDALFLPELLMKVRRAARRRKARFDFVLDLR
jgi:protocatechuate 3,4-dioxygenase beta subunit